MARPNLNDLTTFVAVAESGSFTGAAAHLGVSTAAVSYTIRKLEQDVGVRLLNRTTRSVAPTEAGERLLNLFAPMLDHLDEELAQLSALRDTPTGTVRITSDEYAVEPILLPAIAELSEEYPDIEVEVVIDYGLTDIVAEKFDAGVRLGETIEKDMMALPISGEMQSVVVSAPSHMAGKTPPLRPQDLTRHRCINLRLPTHGRLYSWEFSKEDRSLEVNVGGGPTFNSVTLLHAAARLGLGLAYLPLPMVADDLKDGHLVRFLDDWTPPYDGYQIYFSGRRQMKPALRAFLDVLRRRRHNFGR